MDVLEVTQEWQRAGVHYVRIDVMVKHFQVPLSSEFDDRDTPTTPYVLALEGNLPIGTCRFRLSSNGIGKIERVCVVADYQKKGVGRAIVLFAESCLKKQGATSINITSREEAIGFYETIGYHADWNQIDENDMFKTILMFKKLP